MLGISCRRSRYAITMWVPRLSWLVILAACGAATPPRAAQVAATPPMTSPTTAAPPAVTTQNLAPNAPTANTAATTAASSAAPTAPTSAASAPTTTAAPATATTAAATSPASATPAPPFTPPANNTTAPSANDAATALAYLKWPNDDQQLRLLSTAHVFVKPGETELALGKVVRGTATTWRQLFIAVPVEDLAASAATKRKTKPKTPRKCQVWAEIAPRGWVCAHQLAPLRGAKHLAQEQPVLTKYELVPGKYYMVRDETSAYGSVADVLSNTPRPEPLKKVMLKSLGTVDVQGVAYHQTAKGLVAADRLVGLSPSDFAGIDVRLAPLPANAQAAFVIAPRRGNVAVRAAADKKAKKVGTRKARSLVTITAQEGEWVAVGPDQWLLRSDVRFIRQVPRPSHVPADAQWIDVDLDEQVLLAYQGDALVYVTLISSGRVDGTTPVGLYHVRAKAATMRMAGEPGTKETYDVGDIPWAVRFKKGLFLHTSYWHDGFGSKRSHGCVNLAPKDAKFIYQWVAPAVPPGWSELEALGPTPAAWVRIRDTANPNPGLHDYADEPARTVSPEPDENANENPNENDVTPASASEF